MEDGRPARPAGRDARPPLFSSSSGKPTPSQKASDKSVRPTQPRGRILAMPISSRRRAIAFFVVLGVCLVLLAVGLNVGWIILNWREGVLLFLGVIFFALLIAGMIVNNSFLVREIRRNEQHDSFINAVTHELKTPIASIRLYLQTLQRRDVDEVQ